MEKNNIIKPPVEVYYKKQLQALAKNDMGLKPENWMLSPKAVRSFILGLEEPLEYDGEKVVIQKKFYGDDNLVERCIITLASTRGLMLVGEPGTAKTMLSELLSAAISGSSTNTIQGTAGVTEDSIKYSWNYPSLLAKGPVSESLVPAPLYLGMKKGMITRFEEITRCPLEVQDTLISVLSDKVLSIPEFGEEGFIFAKPGFNIIATANTRDKGVNEMSSALKRRFNFETVQAIKDVTLETKIIEQEASKILKNSSIEMEFDRDVLKLLASTFYELREGITKEGHRVDKPSSVMSTAEAVSVYCQTAMHAYYYEDGIISMDSMVQNLMGAVFKENKDDLQKVKNYFNTIIKRRAMEKEDSIWTRYYQAKKWIR